MSRQILIVDDDAQVLRAMRRVVGARHAVLEASRASQALEILERQAVDLVLTDVSMPGMSGLELLERIRMAPEPPPVVVMSGGGTIEIAVRAVQLGAADFLEKPVGPDRVRLTIDNALRAHQLRVVSRHLSRGLDRELVGEGPAMQRLKAKIGKVASSDGRVLILGENGTGKELVARALHAGSPRRDQPLIKLNCAAVPHQLVESELFGHERGAFTSAVATRQGRFELADGGTLFLDEIGDMPGAMQAKLLRVLQEGTYERVGGTRTMTCDVRVIAATNRDVRALVADGTFREDLYYRLAVVTLDIPPLRDRSEDIPELARRFLAAAGGRNGRRELALSEDALAELTSYAFPGNVRELENLMERFAILVDGDRIEAADVRSVLRAPASRDAAAPLYVEGRSLKELVSEAEARVLREALAAHGGKKLEAAAALSVERSHFYKKCRQHDIS